MPYPAKSIANYLIGKSITDPKTSLTPLKVIKLTYIAHGFYLAYTEQALIDEYVEAWKYGPVISSLYHEFKKYGNNPISQLAEESEEIPAHDEDTRMLLNEIWNEYGQLDGLQLSTWTHEAGSPWEITWQGGRGKNHKIDDQLIKHYYKTLLEKANIEVM